MTLGARFVDVCDGDDAVLPIVVDATGALVPPPVPNVRCLRTKILALVPSPHTSHPTVLRGGILYFSRPGRYLIERDLPDCWGVNLWDERRRPRPTTWESERELNPFGGSLYIPPDVTLWLAPGAVLVPARDAVIAIHGPLVCDPTQVFDLSEGGLVVFGNGVPRLLPQWWGVRPGEDHAPAIQAAIDAGIHNRRNRWERPAGTTYEALSINLPLIPVELRGEYRLRQPVSIRGMSNTNAVQDLLGSSAIQRDPILPAARIIYVDGSGPGRTTVAIWYEGVPFQYTRASATPDGLIQVSFPVGELSLRIEHGPIPEGVPGATITLMAPGQPDATYLVIFETPVRAQRTLAALVANGLIEGRALGRGGRGARLVAESTFVGDTLFDVVGASGLTVRNIEFDVEAAPSTVTAWSHLPPSGPVSTHGSALQSCTFVGHEHTLVHLGPPPREVQRFRGERPTALWSNSGWDLTGLVIDDCEFRPREGGVALMIRAKETLPLRVRNCDFKGRADAMISAYLGNFLLDGCRFDNKPPSRLRRVEAEGFEQSDGSDVFLEAEIPLRMVSAATALAVLSASYQGGFTATGCVSRSPRFLSSATPRMDESQYTLWPALLLNVRHVPPQEAAGGISVRWGRQKPQSRRQPTMKRMIDPDYNLANRDSLVIVGGQYRGSFQVLIGCVAPVFVAPRDAALGRMTFSIDDFYPDLHRSFGVTEVYGLEVDSEIR